MTKPGWVRSSWFWEKMSQRIIWRCHLSQIERLVGIRKSSEFPGAAVQVDVAGPEGRQESQPVIHWEWHGKEGLRIPGGTLGMLYDHGDHTATKILEFPPVFGSRDLTLEQENDTEGVALNPGNSQYQE